jgi:YHS domain-containing protein
MRTLLPGIALIALAACSPVRTAAGPGEAIDPVCAYCRDMACIVVPVTKETPRAEYMGKTYYFCSDSCRDSFLKDPEKYLPKPKA